MKFTDAGIRALKPEASRYVAWADGMPGFGLRVSPKGRKTWVYMYRFEGRARMMTLGNYPKMTLREAGAAYGAAAEQVDKGGDPAQQTVATHKADREALTVNALVTEYIDKWAKPRKKSWEEDQRILDHDVKPVWGRRKAASITRRDVLKLLDGIVERGAPIQANRTLAVVRRMFNFAIERDIVAASPAHRVKAPARETKKDRVLTADEIRALWAGLNRAGKTPEGKALKVEMRPLVAVAIQLVLVTCQRKGEVVSARWEDVDEEALVWTIPAHLAKNGQAHRVPLSPLALDLFKEARKKTKGKTHVFHSARTDTHFTPEAINTALHRNLDALGLQGFTPHDLRRTGASHMTSMGISRLTVSKILNHVETGVTAVYDRHSYDAEKRQALDAWGARLQEIASGAARPGNVVAMKA